MALALSLSFIRLVTGRMRILYIEQGLRCKDRKILLEFLECTVLEKDNDAAYLTGFANFLKISGGEKAFLFLLRRVHFTLSGYQPLDIEGRVAPRRTLDEVKARLVAPGNDVRDACACNSDAVRKLSLTDIFSLQKPQ